MPRLPQAEALEQRADRLAPLGDVIEPAVEIEVFERRQLLVDERLVGEIADAPTRKVDLEVPFGRREQASHQGEKRRLPRPIGPRDEKELAGTHLEIEAAKNPLRSEPPAQGARADQTTTSSRTNTKNVTLMTPFIVKKAMSSRFQSLGETSECS